MKKLIIILALTLIAACPTRVTAQTNVESDPAYLAIDKAFDFKAIKPEVNINLPKFLLKDALADLDGGKNDPFAGTGVNVSELIQDIKLIRVVVLKADKNNNEAVASGMAMLRSRLEKWTPIAIVGEKNESVGVYAISDSSGDAIAGLAVLVQDGGGEAVIANVVGHVSLGKIVKAASQMKKFPKDLLKKLTGAAEAGEAEKSKDSPEKTAKSAETSK
jgi:hypothetical protein